MTSDQIKNDNNLDSQYFWIWLKECAYQLAVMNEQRHVNASELDRYIRNHEPLGSTVPPGSDSPLRGKWRVGSNIPLNVYDGNRPVCQCHSFMDALDIVNAMNAMVQPTSGHHTFDFDERQNSNPKDLL
jgi:hypothetical protein